MQIVEVTGYAVRSAVITMRRRGTPLEFVIFPMLHVASPAFYSQVRLRLRECDLVVIEGIRGKSARVSALTLAYRFAPRRRRNGLQEQREELLLPGDATVIRPDVTAAEAIEDLAVEDLPSTPRAEMLADDPVGRALTGRRDRRLLDALGEIHAARGAEPIRVAVVYGAGHVPAIVSGLWNRFGYRPYEAEWLTVLVPA
ncbi:hypothetical protein [Streptomyces sp. NPDC058434]|uniref:hypothetical protein n=1 Tax=Streptomyces sp. NPDC058434 TaxID=3346498 RepID=UPI0036603A7C